MSIVFLLFALALWAPTLLLRQRRDLHMAQQNGYFVRRYLRWVWRHPGVALPPLAILPPLLLAVGLVAGLPEVAMIGWGVAHLLLLLPLLRPAPARKPLVMTARAWRLWLLSLLLVVVTAMLLLFGGEPGSIALMAVSLLLPLSSGLMVLLLLVTAPVEALIRRWYIRDAHNRVVNHGGLTTVGITGSYGKTSTKAFVTELVQRHFTTLATPESYNTPMGVTLTIRNSLLPIHQLFVVEMGAREPGDIAELCRLTPPGIGVLTAIGTQHLETFGSQAVIRDTKAELIESLPADGIAILNWDQPLVREVAGRTRARVVRYALDRPEAEYRASEVSMGPHGSSFLLHTPNGSMTLGSRLLGRHNVSNLLAAIAVADQLGIDLEKIASLVRTIRPVEHRLQLLRGEGGVTIIDDAYNANPEGARQALEVLSSFDSGQRILVTPGLVELGGDQEGENRKLGEIAAKSADHIVLVGPRQTRSIKAGLLAAGFPEERLQVVRSLDEARAALKPILQPGDTILFENDLPDSLSE